MPAVLLPISRLPSPVLLPHLASRVPRSSTESLMASKKRGGVRGLRHAVGSGRVASWCEALATTGGTNDVVRIRMRRLDAPKEREAGRRVAHPRCSIVRSILYSVRDRSWNPGRLGAGLGCTPPCCCGMVREGDRYGRRRKQWGCLFERGVLAVVGSSDGQGFEAPYILGVRSGEAGDATRWRLCIGSRSFDVEWNH